MGVAPTRTVTNCCKLERNHKQSGLQTRPRLRNISSKLYDIGNVFEVIVITYNFFFIIDK